MDNQNTLLQKASLPPEQKTYRVVGIAMFAVAAALLAVRTVSHLISSAVFAGEVRDEVLVNLIFEVAFSIAVQAGILLAGVFLIYKRALKKSAREVLEFSNFRRTKGINYALAVPIGFLALFVTLGFSTIWRFIIIMFGYTPTAPADTYTDTFNPGIFILELFLIAVLPGICEEFAIRGGLLSTMRKSFKGRQFYIIMALAFGLFHQNITQVFYTALFGGAMAFLAVKSRSIYPCMIVHFLNNGISMYLGYAEHYGWFAGGLYDFIWDNLFIYIFVVFPMLTAGIIGLLAAVAKLNQGSGESSVVSGQWPVVSGQLKEDGSMPRIPNPEEGLYRPTLADNAFFIGAIVIAALFTVFSFVWGLFY